MPVLVRFFLLSVALFLVGCSYAVGPRFDGGVHDGGGPRDAGSSVDAAHDAASDGAADDFGADDLGVIGDDAAIPDASSHGDGGGSIPCGEIECGDGMQCCSETCSLCAPVGVTCPAIACVDGGAPDVDAWMGTPTCRTMDAHGEGMCDHLLGYAYDGLYCHAVRGCTCVGTDCSGLYVTLADCTAATAVCTPSIAP